MANQAPIFTDTWDLCEWLLRHLQRDPSVLARTLCDDALALMDLIAWALKDWRRDERLEDADERLLALRLHLRLAGSLGLFEESQMLFALEATDRIGRQLGGWQRARHPA